MMTEQLHPDILAREIIGSIHDLDLRINELSILLGSQFISQKATHTRIKRLIDSRRQLIFALQDVSNMYPDSTCSSLGLNYKVHLKRTLDRLQTETCLLNQRLYIPNKRPYIPNKLVFIFRLISLASIVGFLLIQSAF